MSSNSTKVSAASSAATYVHPPKDTKVWSRGRKFFGFMTGSKRRCRLTGCGDVRYGVRWPDSGRLTWPCRAGMQVDPHGDWEII